MYAAIGIVILIVMVFGGFAITGGALGPVLHALPHEMLIIGGAAIGALVTGNSLHGLKAIGGAFGKVFKGPKHTKQDHIDVIILCTKLMKLLRAEGPVALESHVTDPANSALFAEFPRLLANKELTALICDTLTLIVVSSGTLEVHAVEEVMDNAMKTHFHELHEPQHALQGLADALPALGIVAAVLGVVKTMGSIDQPPSVLGGHDRLGAGRHLPGGAAGLWHGGAHGGPPEADHRGRRTDLPRGQAGDHREPARLAAAAGGGIGPVRPGA